MSDKFVQDLTFYDKTNANDNFRDITLNFGNIETIPKNTEIEFDKIITNYQSEIIKLLCVVDINQILSDPEYISKNLLRQIEKILTFEEFKLYFKLDKKNKQTKNKNEGNDIQNLNNSKNNMNPKMNEIHDNTDKNLDENINLNIGKDKKREKENDNGYNEQNENINYIENANQNSIKDKKISETTNTSVENNKSKSGINLTYDLSSQNVTDPSLTPPNLKVDKDEEIELNPFQKKIINELNLDTEEIILDGKDYESKVRTYFKIMLDYCSDQNLKIESNNGCSLEFMYKLYKKLINKENKKVDERITGNEKIYPTAEFDLLIKDVKKSTILNIVEKFEGNIIGKNNLNNLDEKKEYQIIGEVAKDILHQSPDKIKQISKYIDIILINAILKKVMKKLI